VGDDSNDDTLRRTIDRRGKTVEEEKDDEPTDVDTKGSDNEESAEEEEEEEDEEEDEDEESSGNEGERSKRGGRGGIRGGRGRNRKAQKHFRKDRAAQKMRRANAPFIQR